MATHIAFDLVSKRITTATAGAATCLYTDLLTDTLYAAVSTTVLPQRASAADHQTAVFRSAKAVLADQRSFACLRLEGPISSAVVRIYADGVLAYTTPSITTQAAVRIPAIRAREWEFEIESAGRVTAIVLAGSAAELASAGA